MKAAVLVEPGKFEILELPIPPVLPDDVLIRIVRCGICGTDMHMFKGHYAADQLPIVPGHEFSGIVEEIGEDVGHLSVGMRVVADINEGCGMCFYCRRNEVLNCAEVRQIGITRNGGFAEYAVVPARLVIPAAPTADFDLLALVEPVACVVRAARKADVRFGQSVAIIGAGPIGNLHVQMMRTIGAAPIIVIEPSHERAELARQAGADAVVTDPSKASEAVRHITGGRGADVVIESVGHPKLYAQALELVRPGGHVAAFGLTSESDSLELPLLETVLREYSIKGSVAGMGVDMHDALTLVTFGRFDLTSFRGVSYQLSEIQRAFEDMPKRPEVLKIQIDMT